MEYDVIIIGGGQAGLVMGYFLHKSNLSFLIVEKSTELGESWRNRYDSLTLFTPRWHSMLPGLTLTGDSEAYPTKDEIAAYLVDYANAFSLPIRLNTEVKALLKIDQGFKVVTVDNEITAKKVVIATGAFQKPFIPTFASALSSSIVQLHSSQYKNIHQLSEGSVLVVGAGNSGAQIAVEVSNDREVFLSAGHKIRFLPQDIGKKSIFWWFDKFGLYKAKVNSKIGQWIKNNPDPIFGDELRLKIKSEAISVFRRVETINNDVFIFQDKRSVMVNNVIWATGFYRDYGWISIPKVTNEKGDPIHNRGISNINGLYFIGLPWQTNRSSSLLQGVGSDASYLYKHIVNDI
ncbi:flavin-containing monooxygenase [Niallia sp. JL1B1071]|uniref:flavin-containing monooxygenase n=1 Tax=Niallia tiangongensis TaxID=3237105 RepID=UPI0037DC37D5